MSLSSLLVQRELATIRDVEEALARQVLYGGDLATNLLEVARVDEGRLTALLAESFGLLPAPSGELAQAPPEARVLVTQEQAVEQGIVPLGLDASGLIVASSAPLSPELEQELGFATSRPIVVRIAPIFRILQAISRDYGVPLVRRHARLLTRLAQGGPPPAAAGSPAGSAPSLGSSVQSEPPPAALGSSPAVVQQAPVASSSAVVMTRIVSIESSPQLPEVPEVPEAPAPVAAQEPAEDDIEEAPKTVAEPPGSPIPREALASVPPPAAVSETRLTTSDRPPDTRDSEPPLPPQETTRPPSVVLVGEPTPTADAAAEASPAEAPVKAPSPAVHPATEVFATFVSEDARAHKRPGKRRRGPLTFEVAKKEMDEASERDHVLDLFFEFARQFFEYSAFFILHGDVAEGRDASGAGASRDKVAGMGVPLDAPSVFLTSKNAQVPVFVRPDGSGYDHVLFVDLERVGKNTIGLLPIVVRRRVVAVLLGDDGDTPVEAAGVKDVTSFAALAGAAFERLIVRKKQGEKKPSLPPRASVPSKPEAAAVLGRVLSEPPASMVAPEPVVAAEPEPVAPVEPVVPEPVDEVEVAPAAVLPAVAPKSAPPVAHDVSEPDVPELSPEANEAAGDTPLRPLPIPAEAVDETPAYPSEPSEFALSDPAIPVMPAVEVEVPQPAPLPREEPVSSPAADVDEPAPISTRVVEVPKQAPQLTEEMLAAASAETPIAPSVVESDPPEKIAVPAHLPPPSRGDLRELPSVIVDVGDEYGALVDRVVAFGDESAETRLLHAGQHAMPAILSRFPGPVRLDVTALPEGSLPRAGECGPVLRLVARQRRVALPFVLTLVNEPETERRFWATYLLSELPYVEAIDPAVTALFDREPRVRLAARTATRVLGELYPSYTVDRLARVLAEPRVELVRKVITLQMLGEVRDPASVPHLVPRLVDPQPEVAAAARASLILVSRQDFGLHLSHWNEWFDKNRHKQRVEWLIDALMHPASGLRLAALEELVKLTRNAFGYQDDSSRKERERVMQKFQNWWAVEGRARYGR
jgi:hypothetical protein